MIRRRNLASLDDDVLIAERMDGREPIDLPMVYAS